MDGIETERDLSLDSTFFVAFDLTHRALKSGLAQASSLSVTQYRVLVKLPSAGPDGIAHQSARREFAGSDEQPRREALVGNLQFFHLFF